MSLTISELVGAGDVPSQVGHSDKTPGVKPGAGKAGAQSEADAASVAYVNQFYATRRAERRPYEGTWFENAALIRGLSNTRWNPLLNTLESRKAPAHRSRDTINIVLPKVNAKLSKFLKGRPAPSVAAASTDHEDILNAKASTKVLLRADEVCQCEEQYEEALLTSMQCGKGFWWFRWNEQAIAQVKEPADPLLLQKEQIHDLPLGDVAVELGDAFELLVSDMGVSRIGRQNEIMRVKARLIADVEVMFPELKGKLTGELHEHELFQYQRQIAQLGASATGGATRENKGEGDEATYVAVKELFTRPGGKFPKGRYRVVVGDQLALSQDELPYGLADNVANPFPVVEFSDNFTAGQFWPTTMVEQLGPIQRQRTRIRNRMDEHGKLNLNPKIFIPKQANMHPDAWNNEVGEKIPINWQPGMPPPSQWVIQPGNFSADGWRLLELLDKEADIVSSLYPAAMGSAGATSGFDTNLLQEAGDSVHAPAIRRNELALKDAYFKMRRIMKLGYDIPRLISIVGRDKQPEVFEFSNEQIDEHANIVIETTSALPLQKHARIEAILKMDERQLFGPPGDPQRNRRVMRMMQLGTADEADTLAQRDEDRARLENLHFSRGEPVEDPMPWENHDIEYEIHTDLLKSNEIINWPPEQRATLVRHTILHVKWKNPQNALQLAAVFGMQDVVAEIQQTMLVQQQFSGPPQAGPPPTEGAPPPQGGEAPPPPQPPQAPAA
jgi:hypothetical protein